MNTLKVYLNLFLGIIILIISFGCSNKEDEMEQKKKAYNKKLMRGLRGNDTTIHGVKLLPIK